MSLILESLSQSSAHIVGRQVVAKKVKLKVVDVTHFVGHAVVTNTHPFPMYLEVILPGQHTNQSVLPTVQDSGHWTEDNAYSANETDGQLARRTEAFRKLIPIQPLSLDGTTAAGHREFDRGLGSFFALRPVTGREWQNDT